MPTSISIPQTATEADRQVILDGLAAYNIARAGPSGYAPVAILLTSDEGLTVGGLWGRPSYDWLFVELLFVPDDLRGQGLGGALMREAEAMARRRGCVGVWLDTFGFQAPGFYLKQGYEVFGELPDHPRGTTRTFLRKVLG